jgi:hypothetical protein
LKNCRIVLAGRDFEYHSQRGTGPVTSGRRAELFADSRMLWRFFSPYKQRGFSQRFRIGPVLDQAGLLL